MQIDAAQPETEVTDPIKVPDFRSFKCVILTKRRGWVGFGVIETYDLGELEPRKAPNQLGRFVISVHCLVQPCWMLEGPLCHFPLWRECLMILWKESHL